MPELLDHAHSGDRGALAVEAALCWIATATDITPTGGDPRRQVRAAILPTHLALRGAPQEIYYDRSPETMIARGRGIALITGASAGIGLEFCRQLAAAGYAIVAVARRSERLAALARELELAYGARVTTLTIDLGEAGAAAAILKALAGVEIDVLINNAGYGVPGRYLSSPWPTHARFQRVMLDVVAELSHGLVSGMCARQHGTIINVASVAGFLPGSAGHTLYAAVKAWMICFSESLALESEAQGVRVCALCPGFTYSEFHDVTGTRAQLAGLPSWLWMSAERVVREGLAAASAGRMVYIPGRINRVIVMLARVLPRVLLQQISRRQSRRFRATH